MKTYLLFATLATLTFTGCTNTQNTLKAPTEKPYAQPTAEKYALFKQTMRKVALSTQDEPKYQKMALDTPEKKSWFRSLMYRLWDRQISRREFVSEGIKKYPARSYEFNFVANGFQKHS